MDTFTGIKVFRQVVESGSFAAAADRLDMSAAMVSKHVMHLEERLGTRLLNRNTRTLSLTEPGRIYFDRCRTILDDLENTELELGSLGSAPRGTLRVTCPAWFAGRQIAQVFAEFRRRYPEIVIDASFEDRYVDLVEEGYDVALRVAASSEAIPGGLVARALRPMPFFVTGSREYLKRHGVPKSPQDLASHDFVGVGNFDALTLSGPDGKVEVPVRVVLRYRTLGGVASAVEANVGLAPLPTYFLFDPVFKEVLTPVLTRYSSAEPTLHLVYVSRKYLPLKTRAFMDFIIEHVSKLPDQKLIDKRSAALAASGG